MDFSFRKTKKPIENKRWDIIDLLIEYGLKLEYFEWDIMRVLSETGDMIGYDKWIKKVPRGINIKDKSAIAIRYAASNGQSDLVCYLIEQGASVTYKIYIADWPPIVYAVRYCSIKAIKAIIDAGADIHFDNDMIFGKEITDIIWQGEGPYLSGCLVPRRDVIEYLESIRE